MATGDKLMTASEIKAVTDTKVDVVSGKGLSTNDYTDAEKAKVANAENVISDMSGTVTVGPAAIVTTTNAATKNVDGLIVDIKPVQTGDGDPSPDNVRPISGWTGAKVTRCGVNLVPNALFDNQSYINSNGVRLSVSGSKFVLTGTATSSGGRLSLKSQSFLLPAGIYTLSCSKCVATVAISTASNGNFISNVDGNTRVRTFTIDSEQNVIVGFNVIPETTYDEEIAVQLERGSTATDYEPYHGNIYDITFPTEAGTVYGGTLDVAGGTLTVDTIAKTLNGTETWSESISANTRYVHKLLDALGENAVLCTNMFQVTSGGTVTGTCFIDVNKSFQVNPGMSSISEFKEFLQSNNLQVVYKLATPVTYQLTPTQIALLSGSNTVYADCGDVTLSYWRTLPNAIESALQGKVDKVNGKGLSTEDYTTAEKTKLANIEAGAQVNTITGIKGNAESSYRTGNVNITAANIGLGNVNNTSDADKPVSTAVQAALNLKVDSVSGKGLSTNDFTDAYKAQLDALNATIQSLTSRIQTLEAKNYILYDA